MRRKISCDLTTVGSAIGRREKMDTFHFFSFNRFFGHFLEGDEERKRYVGEEGNTQ